MSGSEQTAEFIYLIAILVLVISAFMVRRVPIGQGLRMFAGWVIIFLAAFVAFSLKDNIIGFARQVMDERRAESTGMRQGEELRIKQSLDGHFWVDAEINGQKVRFLIDSGATTTSLSSEVAARAGIEASSGIPAIVQTANGVVQVQRARAERLRIGHIERENVAVHVSDAFGNINVLGMNFLSSLAGWRVEGRNLILTP